MPDMIARFACSRGSLKTAVVYLSVTVLCLLCAGSNRRQSVISPAVIGAYRVEFRGTLNGSGNAIVNPTGVIITGIVRDEAGNTGPFVAPNLPLSGGRFSGSGRALGLPVQISGRLDAPADTLRTARLVCNFDTAKGTYGRAVGIKRDIPARP